VECRQEEVLETKKDLTVKKGCWSRRARPRDSDSSSGWVVADYGWGTTSAATMD